jgi:hypothetical protein
MSYGMAESELPTKDEVLRQGQGAMSYKFPDKADPSKEVKRQLVRVKFWLLTTNHEEWRIFGGGFRRPRCLGAD